MPKKKIIHHNEPVSGRPHRNMKAKVVFDPSDSHIPKKRAKYSYKTEKPIEASTVKKTINDRTRDRRKKRHTTKPKKSLPVNPVTESLNGSSTDINTISSTVSPINSPVKSVTPDVTPEKSKNCFICLTTTGKTELINCPICLIKAHRHCLIVDEPMWKFKLDLCSWFCKQCRKKNCSKCLEDDSRSEIQCRCITCEVGLHSICYESYDIKPLHKLETDMYVCIPCMTLATQINPEEEVEEEEEEQQQQEQEEEEEQEQEQVVEAVKADIEDDVVSLSSTIVSISSDEYDTDSKSSRSSSGSSDYEEYTSYQNNDIPNILKWTKDQMFEYLAELLPQEIIDQLTKYDLDGRAIQLLSRNDILSMGLKLGHALKFYKQVRILQTQSTFNRLFWE